MFATTQARSQFEDARALRESLKAASAVNRSGRIFLGTVLLLSAIGLWGVPVEPGDAAMRLIKLLFSTCLLALGAMFILSASRRRRRAEIRFDTRAREIHIVERSDEITLRFDELADVAFGPQAMTARSTDGRVRLTLPINDGQTERMLRRAFPDAG